MPLLKRFLPSFFFYSMGVQTIMLVATVLPLKSCMKTEELITIILIIQIVAIGGAMLMSRLSDKYGNVRVLIFVVFIWIGICIAAYFTTTPQFYIIAVVVGLGNGRDPVAFALYLFQVFATGYP
jgi:UMF1 family MFS transporter